jgi:hypothetical protein
MTNGTRRGWWNCTEKFFPHGRKFIMYLQHTRIKRPRIIELAHHVACIGKSRMQSKFYSVSGRKRRCGSPCRIWNCDIVLILGKEDVRDWTHLANLGTRHGIPGYGNETSGSRPEI